MKIKKTIDWKPKQILKVLDRACTAFTFPMLDNGYVYLAATRLSMYRSITDWAIVIEVFGFSPRSGLPDTHIYTFASTLRNRKSLDDFVSKKAYRNYIKSNPHNESRFVFPIDEGEWQDEENPEDVALDGIVVVRGRQIKLPALEEYSWCGIKLESERPAVFELCRYLACNVRNDILASETERRVNLLPEMRKILQLEEWYHPDIAKREFPSAVSSFKQFAEILVTGNPSDYNPFDKPNTHWSNWPEGGRL